MSFAVTAVVAVAAGAVYSGYQQKKAISQQKHAMWDAEKEAQKQAAEAEKQFNRMNQKKPNIAAIAAGNGVKGSPTMLTGSAGVDPASLTLGQNKPLGS